MKHIGFKFIIAVNPEIIKITGWISIVPAHFPPLYPGLVKPLLDPHQDSLFGELNHVRDPGRNVQVPFISPMNRMTIMNRFQHLISIKTVLPVFRPMWALYNEV
jgi:hypothetical protein